MRRILFVITMAVLLVTGCDVHEWPDLPETVPFHLKLDYRTDMTMWPHSYDGENVAELRKGPDTASVRPYGTMRYIIRAYPFNVEKSVLESFTHEFILFKDIADGYNDELTISLPPGSYSIMVWSDMQQDASLPYFYNYSNFGEIALTGEYKGNDDWRDAFRGKGNITLVADIMERLPDTLSLSMERPLAKYEFITTDIAAFVQKEITRAEAKSKADGVNFKGETKVNLEDYRVEFQYVGFVPSTYSLYTDKVVDSFTGVAFNSRLKCLSDTTASLGFDYVFTNATVSSVTLQLIIYDKEGICLSASEPIKVPIGRNHYTTVTGMLLMSEAKGGISVNPQYEGDHNLIFP